MGSYGGLRDTEKWHEQLAPELFQDLDNWATGKAINISHRGWLSGESGSYVAKVQVEPNRGQIFGGVLKVLPPNIGRNESTGINLARQHSPPDFAKAHLVLPADLSPLSSGWWVHLQRLSNQRPLAEFINEPEFGDYCATIVTSLMRSWNDKNSDRKPVTHPAPEYLKLMLADFWAENDGLRELGRMAQCNIGDPQPWIMIRGRGDRLRNPLALVCGTSSDHDESVEIYIGNGHGDLNLNNILLPVDELSKKPRVENYQLIDLGRFRPDTPVARDPTKLLLSATAMWLPSLAAPSALRHSLAELILAPGGHPASAPVAGYRAVAEEIHVAAESWAEDRHLMTSRWERQSQLVVIASALRFAGNKLLSDDDRLWFLELAALATDAFLRPELHEKATRTPPTQIRAAPVAEPEPLLGASGDTRDPSLSGNATTSEAPTSLPSRQSDRSDSTSRDANVTQLPLPRPPDDPARLAEELAEAIADLSTHTTSGRLTTIAVDLKNKAWALRSALANTHDTAFVRRELSAVMELLTQLEDAETSVATVSPLKKAGEKLRQYADERWSKGQT